MTEPRSDASRDSKSPTDRSTISEIDVYGAALLVWQLFVTHWKNTVRGLGWRFGESIDFHLRKKGISGLWVAFPDVRYCSPWSSPLFK